MTRRRIAVATMPPKARVEALSDGIFSVAMTLLVLDIKLPEGLEFASNADMLKHFASVGEAFGTYVVSFLVLAMFWIAQNYQFRYVKYLDRTLLWTNIAFLLLTTTVPFTTNLIATHANLSLSVVLYAANLLLLGVTLLVHQRRLSAQSGLATEALTPRISAAIDARLRLLCVVPILAIVVAQFSPRWALRMFYLLAVLHFVPHTVTDEESPGPSADADPREE
jgi:uncharacterized membrane protein